MLELTYSVFCSVIPATGVNNRLQLLHYRIVLSRSSNLVYSHVFRHCVMNHGVNVGNSCDLQRTVVLCRHLC